VIEGCTQIGDDNQFFQFCSIGAPPQDLKWRGEESQLQIGNGNIVRECVTIQPGVMAAGGVTRIGDRNLFMACSHVAHDCTVGSQNWFANSSALAGHVSVGSNVILGGLSAVHQFCRVGDHAFLAGGAMASLDIPPFCVAQGDRARVIKINDVGLRRNGFVEAQIRSLKHSFRALFFGLGTLQERIDGVRRQYTGHPEVAQLLEFIIGSERGVAYPNRPERSAKSDVENLLDLPSGTRCATVKIIWSEP
jgi:UDP-N-acetylglucosamine acyltransferase